MTVKQLIGKLKKLPLDTNVYINIDFESILVTSDMLAIDDNQNLIIGIE